MGAFELCVCSA